MWAGEEMAKRKQRRSLPKCGGSRTMTVGCALCSCLTTSEVKTAVWSFELREEAAGGWVLFCCRTGGRTKLPRGPHVGRMRAAGDRSLP